MGIYRRGQRARGGKLLAEEAEPSTNLRIHGCSLGTSLWCFIQILDVITHILSLSLPPSILLVRLYLPPSINILSRADPDLYQPTLYDVTHVILPLERTMPFLASPTTSQSGLPTTSEWWPPSLQLIGCTSRRYGYTSRLLT